MSLRTRTFRLSIALALVVALALSTAHCADSGGSDEPLADVTLALTGEALENAFQIDIDFTKLGEDEPSFSDSFAPNGADASRNYRIEPGDYDIFVSVKDADFQTTHVGEALDFPVGLGDNAVPIALAPVDEDLGDVLVELEEAIAKIGTVAADAKVVETGFLQMTIDAIPSGTEDVPEDTVMEVVGDVSLVFSPEGEEGVFQTFSAVPTVDDPMKFAFAIDANWVGKATVNIGLYVNGSLADFTTKEVVGNPSIATQEFIAALESTLATTEDGTFEPVDELTTTAGSSLSAEGLEALNLALVLYNDAIIAGAVDYIGTTSVYNALIYASLGFWDCALLYLKCAALVTSCIPAIGAAAAGCAVVCAETLGLACAQCLAAAGGAAVAVCVEAADCIAELIKENCL